MAATMLAEQPTTDEARSPDLTVRRAQQGETAAFEQLYHAHVGRVYALCLRLCGDPARAEELTQDVFVRAWEKLESFQGKSAFSTWLHRLAVNVVLGDRRSEGVRVHRVFATDEPEKYETPSMRGSDPGTAMDLERAIAQLPPGARAVFVLHDVEGYKHEEIAQMQGSAVGTCKAQLHRARRLLREALGR
jgi:RNA polymerase sigma-70 factor (ECF subfamily)